MLMEQPKNLEDMHEDPFFEKKKSEYFQNFIVRNITAASEWKKNGLINKEGSRGWRNVARHQLLSGVMTETIMELMGSSGEDTKRLTHLSLIHDADKRVQQENQEELAIIREALGKNDFPLAATGSNFTDFDHWDVGSRILRYVDSSVAEEGFANTFGARDAGSLPKVILVPWRERVQGFKDSKVDEGELGRAKYGGITTWEKLEQIMNTIEQDLYDRIIQRHPNLAERYPDHSYLTQLIEDRIHQKILAS